MTYADLNSADLQRQQRLSTTESVAGPGTRAAPRKGRGRKLERIEMRLLVGLTYPLFLMVAIANRLGLRRPAFDAVVSTRSRSVFAEARETAEATIPSAFRG
jgi:hypothetical protein